MHLLNSGIHATLFALVAILVHPGSALSQSTCPDKLRGNGVDTFGVPVCATDQVSNRALVHANKVMRSLLDYDQNGVPDSPVVLDEVLDSGAFFAVFPNERAADRLFDSLNDSQHETYDALVSVFEDEMDISGREGWDPTIEEALHLITQFGYAEVFPDIFGEFRGSAIADLMDEARGGYHARVPNRYPNGAYYTYDDRTCDYSCQVTEFTFWAITSMRGLNRLRADDIGQEWRLHTPALMQQRAPALVTLLRDPSYGILF
ncbi:MAG: hypothetical protein CBC49_009055 [Alphaproteobacteria bacterium TMED89]|nr:hypothetical protein [Rhodospirillaceae bacterium]MAV48187.1 hypothetical protein [Rhodospirillaceae bacterium]RPH11924.1 MAG: hypothetical protein CBC49_008820 [Alphaproteobacteria bacterium TMED89]RPH11963.1 MAG: hypothetical protein CBC49_009055 [Alphaproteobacteria bacterium TMED89]